MSRDELFLALGAAAAVFAFVWVMQEQNNGSSGNLAIVKPIAKPIAKPIVKPISKPIVPVKPITQQTVYWYPQNQIIVDLQVQVLAFGDTYTIQTAQDGHIRVFFDPAHNPPYGVTVGGKQTFRSGPIQLSAMGTGTSTLESWTTNDSLPAGSYQVACAGIAPHIFFANGYPSEHVFQVVTKVNLPTGNFWYPPNALVPTNPSVANGVTSWPEGLQFISNLYDFLITTTTSGYIRVFFAPTDQNLNTTVPTGVTISGRNTIMGKPLTITNTKGENPVKVVPFTTTNIFAPGGYNVVAQGNFNQFPCGVLKLGTSSLVFQVIY